MDIVVAYDIATTTAEGQRRLQRIAKICEGYGVRIQYSVFECHLTSQSLARLMNDLRDTIDHAEDRIVIYRVNEGLEKARTTIGQRKAITADQPWIV
jgi:CRISPR-associated protein Cas2